MVVAHTLCSLYPLGIVLRVLQLFHWYRRHCYSPPSWSWFTDWRVLKNKNLSNLGRHPRMAKKWSKNEGILFVLFCLYLWDPSNWDASDHVLRIFGKLSTRRGAWPWCRGVCTCNAKVLEYRMISSLKIKINHSWKFWRNWNVRLVLLERFWARFNAMYLVRFGFRMWRYWF